MPAARNHYQILNVSPDAEPVVIEAAYRALMKKYHPDQASASAGPGNAPTAAEINHAFATLRDPERRAEYDRREWTRAQNIQLAAYRPPPPQRLSRAFGWGGWIVALVLGTVLAVMANHVDQVSAGRAAAARAAAAAEPDLRSQPTLPDEPLVAPASLAQLPVEVGTAAAAPVAAAAAAVAAAATPEARPAARAQRKFAKAKPRRPQSRAASARTAREKDFLERQGYIY